MLRKLTLALIPYVMVILSIPGCRGQNGVGKPVTTPVARRGQQIRLNTSILNPGVTVYAIMNDSSSANQNYLLLLHADSQKVLQKLGDLSGSVRIRSADNALTFVRLRTLSSFQFFWPQPAVVEIVSYSQLKSLPSFSPLFAVRKPRINGVDAIISDKLYSSLKFRRPSVTKISDGYNIRRWVYNNTFPPKVELFDEHVGFQGEYEAHVLHSHPIDERIMFLPPRR